ncbi:type-F conjugative transfer system pilin assembly protein TrbC [Piscirickettsia salmonis]|uniref:type-F conjugative transfer system pilin assembly protein TrbC n=1 Tax=Piscirickettsia salmonis TaxID=1238 RepID=UPI0006BC5529|nr:type-F conjugative transfer system pilin assembly protein TrbC [Piscirickettsia salmonis]ALA26646.1 conjugal transfer protein TrbC [Piscirickettsia salmonis]APS45859.1 hypothetical protein AVI48_15615 [Piscirickettsia salmonis]APS49258.1 hypothetical protein AVI49_16510 [Piscirickettsia salmonis]QGO82355.1 conjugal transfer pilus assembly protein TrbC [Piscirickettsia salmonis]QGP24184.1 conjugal transfer pilus assembly protein TrbC [Piscirickettsia salmonis]
MKKIALTVILSIGCQIAFANFNDEVNAYKVHEKSLIDQNSSKVSALASMSQANVKKNLSLLNQFMGQAQHSAGQTLNHGGKAANGAMLFISTSMPKPLIIQMSIQASKYNIPVIMRGLIDNSMPKTLQAILNIKVLAKKEHLKFSGISIDPVWFDQFDITAVPAFVVTQRPAGCISQKMCPNQPFDVIYGNQSIHDSLLEIAKQGSATPKTVAQTILRKGRV